MAFLWSTQVNAQANFVVTNNSGCTIDIQIRAQLSGGCSDVQSEIYTGCAGGGTQCSIPYNPATCGACDTWRFRIRMPGGSWSNWASDGNCGSSQAQYLTGDACQDQLTLTWQSGTTGQVD
jgi:hypothetical protein